MEMSTTEVRISIPAWKRLLDVVGALTLLVLLSPVMILLALIVKISTDGPVFFIQRRLGLGCKVFPMIKFRTMKLSTESPFAHRQYLHSLPQGAKLQKPDFEDRLIPGGDIIRKFSLDELPQLINVLRGEMSLVGPRPDVFEADDYRDPDALRRFDVLPGITGLWQVSGKNELTFDEMIDLDLEYVDKHSIWMDLKILYKTIFVVLRCENS